MSESSRDPESTVRRVLHAVRRRAVIARGLSVSLAALALGPLVLAALAAWVGPVASPWATGFAIAVAVAPPIVGLAAAYALRHRLSAREVASLFRALDPALASQVRSSVELGHETAPGESEQLARAHRTALAERLARVDPKRVVDVEAAARVPSRAFVSGLLVALVVVFGSDRARSGVYALIHPTARTAQVASAWVVARTSFRVAPPPHRHLPPSEVESAQPLQVPEGSRVTVLLRTAVPARRVILAPPGAEIELRRRDARTFVGEWTARHAGALAVRVRTEDGVFLDATSRSVSLIRDQAPRVVLQLDGAETPVAPDAEIGFAIEATDDVALRTITRVVKVPSGAELRTPLEPGTPSPRFAIQGSLRLAELGLRPGDSVEVHAEATDDDGVNGPKTTRSEARTITIQSRATEREAVAVDLRAALEATLTALADRLEIPVPEDRAAVARRHARVRPSTDALLGLLAPFATRARRPGLRAPDAALLAGFVRRLGPLAARELREVASSRPAARDVDERIVSALEDGTFLLSDLLAHVELEDAAEIARELASLQRELVSLVEALRRADTPETRSRIAADIERARRRMAELASRLGRMGDEVPGEYRNPVESGTQEVAEDALRSLEQALARGDLDAADRALADLERNVRELARAFESSSEGFAESRFGPRDRAFQEAMEALAGLEAEEGELANGTTRIRRSVTERALSEAREAPTSETRRLADRAAALRSQAEALARLPQAPVDREAVDHAAARLRDAEAALRQGDVGQGQAMMERAAGALDAVARDLDLSALMFPGREGRTRQAARDARQAADQAMGLLGDVLRSVPKLDERLSPTERGALTENAGRQQQATEATERLARRFEEPIEGEPLSVEAAGALRRASETMRRAERAVRESDAVGGAEAQSEAARALRELREELEQSSSSSGGGGGGGGGSGGGRDGSSSPTERVDIPGARGSAEAAARRRRVLDAMGDDVPPAYQGPVRRYYEELLR
ncbi:MAG: DUF4175 family protein [Polyangiales bacterium]